MAFAGLVAASVEKGGRDLLCVGAAGEADGFGVPAAVAAALAVGLLGGLMQGLGVSKLKVPPFVVTLGGMSVFRGLRWSGQRAAHQRLPRSIQGPRPGLCRSRAYSRDHLCPLCHRWHNRLQRQRYGRHIYAVGGNQEAARLSGLNTAALITSVYVISGFCAGLPASCSRHASTLPSRWQALGTN